MRLCEHIQSQSTIYTHKTVIKIVFFQMFYFINDGEAT